MMDQGCGALRSPDDPDDFIFERVAFAPAGYYFAELPAEYDLRETQPSIRDQGPRGTCAAFAAAVIKELQEYKECNVGQIMSPEFIYFHRENKPAGGMYGRNVFQILQKIGCVPEEHYPYRGDEDAPTPHDGLYGVASRFRIANYARVTTVVGLKRALLELGPCYIQLPLYSGRPVFWKGQPGEAPLGGHALVVVGYTVVGFTLLNSWGADWNGDGTVVFPYDDWSLHWECWASIDEKATPTPVCVPKRAMRAERRKNRSIEARAKKSKRLSARKSLGVDPRCMIM